jgi:hypothetical protein
VRSDDGRDIHDKVNAAEFGYALRNSLLETVDASHVNGAYSNDLGASSGGGDRSGHRYSLGLITANDTGIGAKVDQSPNHRRADRAIAACAKDDFVICNGRGLY